MDLSNEAAVIIAALAAAIVGALVASLLAARQLTRQLDHNRDLEDLAELRRILDEATALSAEAARRTNRVYILLTEDHEASKGILEGVDEDEVRAAIEYLRHLVEQDREAHSAFLEGPPVLFIMLQRIMLRLDPEDPITLAYEDVWEALGAFMVKVGSLERDDPLRPVPDEAASELDEIRTAVANAQFRFVRVARSTVFVR